MTTLHGRIDEGVLANLLQYLTLGQASGCLVLVHSERRQGQVYLDRGRVVCVDALPYHDLTALTALLRWRDGRFSFRPEVRAPRNSLNRSTDSLLLEASSRADETPEDPSPASELDPDAVLVPTRLNAPQVGRGGSQRPTAGRGGGVDPRASSTGGPAQSGGRNGLANGRLNGAASANGSAGPNGDGVRELPTRHHRPETETVELSLAALHLWRRLDGEKSLRQLADALGWPLPEAAEAGRELLAAELAEFQSVAVADARFARELMREAIDLLGPVGEIVVEDALYDLGLSADAIPVSAVDDLIQELCLAFQDAKTEGEFLRRAKELRYLFALEPVYLGRSR